MTMQQLSQDFLKAIKEIKIDDSKDAMQHALYVQQLKGKHILGPGVDETENWSRWATIYPHYVAQPLTIKEGRRVDVTICDPTPDIHRIATVLQMLDYKYVIEDKHYPRNVFLRGRIKVDLESAGIRKQDLLVDICRMLATLPPPIEEIEDTNKQTDQSPLLQSQSQQGQQAQSQSQSLSGSKGRGKQKGRGKAVAKKVTKKKRK